MLTPVNFENTSLVKQLLNDIETIPPIESADEYLHYLSQLEGFLETASENPDGPTLSLIHALALRLEYFELWANAVLAMEPATKESLK